MAAEVFAATAGRRELGPRRDRRQPARPVRRADTVRPRAQGPPRGCRRDACGAGAGRRVSAAAPSDLLRWAEIDVDTLADNARLIGAMVRPAHVMAMVKSNGYGHGLVIAARAALDGGATWLGVYTPQEALALARSRRGGTHPGARVEPATDASRAGRRRRRRERVRCRDGAIAARRRRCGRGAGAGAREDRHGAPSPRRRPGGDGGDGRIDCSERAAASRSRGCSRTSPMRDSTRSSRPSSTPGSSKRWT